MKRLREDILSIRDKKSRTTKKGTIVKDIYIDYFNLDIRDMEKNSSFEKFLKSEVSYLLQIKQEFISIAIHVSDKTNIKITVDQKGLK